MRDDFVDHGLGAAGPPFAHRGDEAIVAETYRRGDAEHEATVVVAERSPRETNTARDADGHRAPPAS